MSRACRNCQADLEGTHPTRLYCDPKCRYEFNGDKIRARTRRWRQNNPEWARHLDMEKVLVKRYGITGDQYRSMLERQGGVCKICGRTPEEVSDKTAWRLAVDHCHQTGAVRGLLCRACNTAIGQLQESEEIIMKALEYVRSFS